MSYASHTNCLQRSGKERRTTALRFEKVSEKQGKGKSLRLPTKQRRHLLMFLKKVSNDPSSPGCWSWCMLPVSPRPHHAKFAVPTDLNLWGFTWLLPGFSDLHTWLLENNITPIVVPTLRPASGLKRNLWNFSHRLCWGCFYFESKLTKLFNEGRCSRPRGV